MKLEKLIFILVTLTWGIAVNAQSEWKFQTHIDNNEFYLFEGVINEEYPIEMYLEQTWDFCGTGNNNRWKARGLKGWYQYPKIKKKIPLIGSICRSDPDHYIKLFVPTILLDTINDETCELDKYKEKFIAHSSRFSKLEWKTFKMDSFYSVKLKPVHNFSWNTDVTIGLEIRDIEILEINITKLSEIEFIQFIEILATKEINNNFYAIIEFGHRSNLDSSGSGYCGAGYEKYLGFIKVNYALELEKFEMQQIWSCLNSIPEGKFTFDKEHPEQGIIEKEY